MSRATARDKVAHAAMAVTRASNIRTAERLIHGYFECYNGSGKPAAKEERRPKKNINTQPIPYNCVTTRFGLLTFPSCFTVPVFSVV